jgi:hypothetical protein
MLRKDYGRKVQLQQKKSLVVILQGLVAKKN